MDHQDQAQDDNICDKVGEVVDGIQRSEEYLAKLQRETAEAQNQTTRRNREILQLKEETAKLKEGLGPIQKILATQQAKLLSEEMVLAELHKEVVKAEEELKASKLPMKTEEKELHELIENLMGAALDFSMVVRPDNPTVVPHLKSLVKKLQDLHMEETSLLCELKVLEENEKDGESRLALAKRHENEMIERDRTLAQKEKDLLSQLQNEKQLRDKLTKTYNDTIQQKTSELAVCREEAECLEAGHNTLKIELDNVNSEIEKLKENKQVRPQKRQAASDFWSPPTDDWYPGNTLNESFKSPRYEKHAGYQWERTRGHSAFQQQGWKPSHTRNFHSRVYHNSQRMKVEKFEPSHSSRQSEYNYKSDREMSTHRTSRKTHLAPSTPKTFTRNSPPPTPVENKGGATLPLQLLGGFMPGAQHSASDDEEKSLSQDTSPPPTCIGADYPSAPAGKSTSSASEEYTSEISHESTHQNTSNDGEPSPVHESDTCIEENKSSVTSHHIKYKCTVVVHEDEAI